MKCKRPNCTNLAGSRSRGLCKKHYAVINTTVVDPRPIAARINLLHGKGYTFRALAKVSGVHPETLAEIAALKTLFVLRDTAEKIMAVPVPADLLRLDNARCGPRISSVGTRRRLQGLMVMGHSQVSLGRELGVSPQAVAYWARCDQITVTTAARVRELFDRLQMVPGGDKRARTYALRKGWVPAWAWDEDELDDPHAIPLSPGGGHVTTVEKFRELRELGMSPESIALKLNLKRKTLDYLRRAS